MKSAIYIVWNERNNLGIPIIDEQHKGIVSIINTLHYYVQAGHGQEILKPTMIMLEQYVIIHFKTEETLMVEANYPAYEEHIILHKELLRKTNMISLGVNNEDSHMVLKFLKEWWLGHINIEDRKYTPSMGNLFGTKTF